MKLLLRWLITAAALFVAAWLVPGISVDGNGWIAYAVMAAILSLINAVIRPVLKLLTCPLIILTLGLFTLVINAGTLWVSAYITRNWFDVGFYVDGFWPALWGGLIVSVVSVIGSSFLKDDDEDEKRRRKEQ